MLCNATTVPGDCKGGGSGVFTIAGVNPGVAVTSGQQVAIAVHFAFS